MTGPSIEFQDDGAMPGEDGESMLSTDGPMPEVNMTEPYPAPILNIPEERLDAFRIWLREWIESLESEFTAKHDEWRKQEILYRARSFGPKSFPFDGACGDIVPVMAMAVDPVHARLDTGIFKADPVFTIKALKKSYTHLAPSMNSFIEFYQKHRLHLRQIVSPRLMELTKHGSMILKTTYDREVYNVQSYDAAWKVTSKEVIRFSGPRVSGISVGDFMFPAGYQFLQDCPIVIERQRVLFDWLKIQESSKKLANVDSIKDQNETSRTRLEEERQKSANHEESNKYNPMYYEVLEIWCDYDINGDGLPERLAVTYHYDTDTFLQLRYNWYFHQRKPYTIVPYTITNESLHGIGIGEMSGMFQTSITQWHQMATDNAYLANIRMFVAAKDAQVEDNIRMYAGRVIKVNDPSKDLIPFRMGDTYSSTINERQNLFGLAEKRSGISDYLTGRESPIVGSRATATSTLALIDEGTKRVEQVMENIRNGLSEVMENCIYIWMQYGLDDIDNIVFGDDQVATDVREFFNTLKQDNVGGAIAIDLTATDAKSNRVARQQVQMAIIQVMMTFYEKFVQLGTNAIQAQQTTPAISGLMSDVAESARKMFKDLLVQFDVTDPDQYIPELEKYLNASAVANAGGPAGVAPGAAGDLAGQSGLPIPTGPMGGVASIGERPAEFARPTAPAFPGAR